WINLALTLLGKRDPPSSFLIRNPDPTHLSILLSPHAAYTPGHIHLFYVSYVYKWEPRFQRWNRALHVNRFGTKGKTTPAPSASFSNLEKPDELGPGEARAPSREPSPGPDKVYTRRPNPGPSLETEPKS